MEETKYEEMEEGEGMMGVMEKEKEEEDDGRVGSYHPSERRKRWRRINQRLGQ